MNALSGLRDALFVSPRAEPVTYSAAGQPDAEIRAIRTITDARDWQPTGAARNQIVFRVRAADIEMPVEGDLLIAAAGGERWRVVNADRDPHAPEWLCEVEQELQP